MKKLVFFLTALLLTTQLSAQQSWQWGKRGGGGVREPNASAPNESVVDMAVDPNGNVYTLSNISFDQNDVDVDGSPLTGRYTDVVISSFSCAGKLRWTKVLGSPTRDGAVALRTDALGGIYVTCYLYATISGDSATISTDTVLYNSYRTIFLVKYDTSGNYKWLKRPQPDTATLWTRLETNGTLDMEVDKAGNSYSMCYLSRGLYGTGANAYSVTTPGVHMLRYNKDGIFLGGNPMAITVDMRNPPLTQWWLTRTPSGKFIVNGSPNGSGALFSFGNTTIDRPAFVASFNSNGTLNWVKQSVQDYTSGAGTVLSKAVVDAQENIYMAGAASTGDGFGGVTFLNPGAAPGTVLPIAFKLNAAGTTVWSKYGTGNIYGYGLAGALTTNDEFVLGGSWTGTVKWPGSTDSIKHPAGWLLNIFTTRFNAQTGAYIKMDTLSSPPGDNNLVTAMAADKAGNVYVGGSFQSNLKVAGTTLTAKPGGYFDFFLAKYGTANCRPVGIENINLPAEDNTITLVPNPATTSTRIDYKLAAGTRGATIELFDLMGRRVASQQVTEQVGNWTVDLASLPAGTYLVLLRQNAGATLKTKLVVTH